MPGALLAVLTFGMGMWFTGKQAIDIADQLLIEQGRNFATNISTVIVRFGFSEGSVDAVADRLSTIRLGNAKNVVVYDGQGNPKIHVSDATGAVIIKSAGGYENPPSGIPRRVESIKRIWEPVWDPSGDSLIGWLAIELDNTPIVNGLQSVRAQALLAFAFGACVLLFGSYRLVVNPVNALQRAADAAEALRVSGNHTLPAYRSVVEIERLYDALNKAALTLNDQSRELADHDRFMQTLTNSLTEAVYATDREGRCIFINQAFQQLTGWTEAEMLGHDPWPRLLNRPASSVNQSRCPHHIVMRSGATWQSKDINLVHKDGHDVVTEIMASAMLEQNTVTGAVAVIVDRSLREQELQQLIQARAQAEAANVAKSRFLHVIGHELRTPMNAIIGMTELALSKNPDSEIRRHLQMINDAGALLRGLIDNVLDYAAADRMKGSTLSTSILLTELLDRTVHNILERARRKNIVVHREISSELPRHLTADEGSINRILSIFCDNALKFTESGSITIKAEMIEKISQDRIKIRLQVTDTGIGIDPERIKLLFDEFQQVDMSRNRRYGGVGLGLALARQLAERMGGQVGVDSKTGVGSTFWCDVVVGLAKQTVSNNATDESDELTQTLAGVHPDSVQQVIRDIGELLNQSDFEAGKQIEHYRDLLREISPQDLERMRNALHEFDFDEAKRAFEHLRSKCDNAQKALYTKALGIALEASAQDPDDTQHS